MIFASPEKLKNAGILGINQRNADYILQYNQRKFYPRVDDKMYTKLLALEAGIAVPELYGVVEIEHQVGELPEFLKKYNDFVIKPCQGSGGDGVLVITDRYRDMYRKASGDLINQNEFNHHLSNILSGTFSLGGHPDSAMIEYRVKFHEVFKAISYQGVPDIRVIVFLGVPVMAMVRLPTRLSGGKANLHQGAIGAGIDMATGHTMAAVWRNEIIDEHPDTRSPVAGIEIPEWKNLLLIAARCHELTGLGYIGVDIVLDRDLGPLMLELNARPGLNIQIANHCGLLQRLKLIEKKAKKLSGQNEKIEFALQHFGKNTN